MVPDLDRVGNDVAVVIRERHLALANGDGDLAIALAHLEYWCCPDERGRSRLRVEADGRRWLARSARELEAMFGWTPRQARRVTDALAATPGVTRMKKPFRGAPTTHFHLDLVRYTEAARKALDDRSILSSKPTNAFDGSDECIRQKGRIHNSGFDSGYYKTHTGAFPKSEPPAWLRDAPSLSPALRAVVTGEPISTNDLGDLSGDRDTIDRINADPDLNQHLADLHTDRQLVLCVRVIPGWPADDHADLKLVEEVSEAAGSCWLLPPLVDRFLEWTSTEPEAGRPRGLRMRFRRHCLDVPGHVLDDLVEEDDLAGWLAAVSSSV